MSDIFESGGKHLGNKRRKLMTEIYNYIPEEYSSSKKRRINQGNEVEIENISSMNHGEEDAKETYYDKVFLSSDKGKRKNLEEGEVEPGSSRKKNKREKRKALKEKLSDISKQLHLNFQKEHPSDVNTICNPFNIESKREKSENNISESIKNNEKD